MIVELHRVYILYNEYKEVHLQAEELKITAVQAKANQIEPVDDLPAPPK